MKFFKVFIITLLALFLTGCYTQLQYSQTMKKVTDKKPTSETPVYSWSGEEKAESSQNDRDEHVAKAEYKQEATDEYIPIYYKDYEYATKYGDVYNFYGNDWYGYNDYPYYGPNYTHLTHSFFYDRWLYHSYYDRWYRNPGFYFSITFGWGTPYHHYHRFYGRHYDPFFDYYLYGNFSPFAYNYFYGRSGYGYGYWPDKQKSVNKNVKYGPRTIGTNRVDTDRSRRRAVTGNRSATVTNRASSTVRTRSVGTSRSRGTSGRSTVERTKSRNRSSSSRSRTRGQDQINSDSQPTSRYDYRKRGDEIPLVIDEKQLEQIRARIRNNNRNNSIYRSRINNNRERTTFFNRMKNFFEQNSSRFTNGNNGRTLRSRSNSPSTRRSKINRSSSSTNRSSVTRSKSSSSNTRSRGSSSSRSRSDNSGSSGSDRSRGN